MRYGAMASFARTLISTLAECEGLWISSGSLSDEVGWHDAGWNDAGKTFRECAANAKMIDRSVILCNTVCCVSINRLAQNLSQITAYDKPKIAFGEYAADGDHLCSRIAFLVSLYFPVRSRRSRSQSFAWSLSLPLVSPRVSPFICVDRSKLDVAAMGAPKLPDPADKKDQSVNQPTPNAIPLTKCIPRNANTTTTAPLQTTPPADANAKTTMPTQPSAPIANRSQVVGKSVSNTPITKTAVLTAKPAQNTSRTAPANGPKASHPPSQSPSQLTTPPKPPHQPQPAKPTLPTPSSKSKPVSKGNSVPSTPNVRITPPSAKVPVARTVPVNTANPPHASPATRTAAASHAAPTTQPAKIARNAQNGRPATVARAQPGLRTTSQSATRTAAQPVVRATQQVVRSVTQHAVATTQPVARTTAARPAVRAPTNQPTVRTVTQSAPRTSAAHAVARTAGHAVARAAAAPPATRPPVQQVARSSPQANARTVPQPVARATAQPVVRPTTTTHSAVRTAAQPVVRTTPQPTVRTAGQPIVRTIVKPVAKTNPNQAVRTAVVTAQQKGRQTGTRTVVQSPVRAAVQPLTRVATTPASTVVQRTASGVPTTVRRTVNPQAPVARQPTTTIKQTVARAPQPASTRPQVVARQTPVNPSRPTVQTASVRTVAAQIQRTGTQPVARAIPQTTRTASTTRPVSRPVQGGGVQAVHGTNGTRMVLSTGTTPARTTTKAPVSTIVQPVARAVPHTTGKVFVKPSATIVSQPPARATHVARQTAVPKTQPSVVRQKVVQAGRPLVKNVATTKPGMQGQVRATVVPQAQSRTLGTPVKQVQVARTVLPPGNKTALQGVNATLSRQAAPVSTARPQVVGTATPVRQQTSPQTLANGARTVVTAKRPIAQTTPVRKPVSRTTPSQNVTPQKRPPPVPAEALAAAMAAAAAVEPTPPLQPRNYTTVTPLKPTVAAPRIATAAQPAVVSTPTKAAGSSKVFLSKPGTARATGSTVTTPQKIVQTPTPATTPASTPAREPSRIPAGMTFLPGEHVTIWNHVEKRKIAGNAAPLGKNVERYLRQHPDCEVYVDQDEDRPGSRSNRKRPKYNYHNEQPSAGEHVAIWNRVERRKVAGNAAPLAKNLEAYLRKNPNCEVYNYQDAKDKRKKSGRGRDREEPPPVPEPAYNDLTGTPLDAWKDLNGFIDSVETQYKMDFDHAAELLLTQGDDEDDVSPLILTGPLGVEEPHVMIDLDSFINNDEEICEPLGNFIDDDPTFLSFKGSLEIPNSG